jgi:hypothetical protein
MKLLIYKFVIMGLEDEEYLAPLTFRWVEILRFLIFVHVARPFYRANVN